MAAFLGTIGEAFLSGKGRIGQRASLVAILIAVAAAFSSSSCTILAQSPHLVRETTIPLLNEDRGLIVSESGQIPYQRWRVRSWDDGIRYVWMVGNHDFRKADKVDIILYFHGMHSKDYYRSFRESLVELAAERPSKPFLFVGFVDVPHCDVQSRSNERWKLLVPNPGERPDRLLATVNSIFKSFRRSFRHVDKSKTSIVLAGFSGGGRVLNSVGNWLARSPKEDPYARVFLSRLSKIVYFDCWFEPDILQTVPTLLESNPDMKIVGTVHMEKPLKYAHVLAGKLRMKARKERTEFIGLNGRLVIYRDKSHWDAMIARLRQALDT